MRGKIVAANWKMNLDYRAGLVLFAGIIDLIHAEVRGLQRTVVCCPFIHLHGLAHLAIGHPSISVGAENCHEAESGAFTGEISAEMVRSNDTVLLYGGSCKPGNAVELFSQEDIDGGLIGGASLNAREFVDIVKVYN